MAVVHFDAYELDVAERRLRRAGVEVQLTPKAFDLLALLVERAGRLVRKEELLEALWPDVVVSEANLTQTVFVLRRALGESEERPFVETVPRAGYRFVAAVETVPAVPPAPTGVSASAEASMPNLEPAAPAIASDPGAPSAARRAFGVVAVLLVAALSWIALRLAPERLAPPGPGEPAIASGLISYRQAKAALATGDAWLADRTLAAIPEAADEAPLLRVARINARLNLGDEAAARRLEQEAPWGEDPAALPERDRLWLEAARLRARGDSVASVAPLERLFVLEPTATEVGARLAGALIRSDRAREADLVVARLRQLGSAAADPQVDLLDAQVGYALGDPQRSLAAALAARAKLAGVAAPALLVARAGILEGHALMELGRLDEAEAVFAGAVTAAERAGIAGESARAWRSRALLADLRGRLEEADAAYRSALVTLESSGDLVNSALTRVDLGGVAISRGRFTEALEIYRAALDSEALRSSERRRQAVLANSALARLELGDVEAARRLYAEQLSFARRDGNPTGIVYGLAGAIEVELEAGELARAKGWLAEAERQASEFGGKELLGLVEVVRARCLLAAGDAQGAAATLARARGIAEEVGAAELAAQVAELGAALAAVESRCEDAERSAAAVGAGLGEEIFRVHRATAWAEAARCALGAGQRDRAAEHLAIGRGFADTTDSLRARLRVDLVACALRLEESGAGAAAVCAEELVDRARDAGYVVLGERTRAALRLALTRLPRPVVEPATGERD